MKNTAINAMIVATLLCTQSMIAAEKSNHTGSWWANPLMVWRVCAGAVGVYGVGNLLCNIKKYHKDNETYQTKINDIKAKTDSLNQEQALIIDFLKENKVQQYASLAGIIADFNDIDNANNYDIGILKARSVLGKGVDDIYTETENAKKVKNLITQYSQEISKEGSSGQPINIRKLSVFLNQKLVDLESEKTNQLHSPPFYNYKRGLQTLAVAAVLCAAGEKTSIVPFLAGFFKRS